MAINRRHYGVVVGSREKIGCEFVDCVLGSGQNQMVDFYENNNKLSDSLKAL
jgi:hypothetical protein